MADTFSPAMERFFEELAKTPREWRLNECGAMVCHGNTCPVCAVANMRVG